MPCPYIRKAGTVPQLGSVTARWSEDQIQAFGKIWRQWDGCPFLATTDLPILEVWGDRGRPRPTLDELRIPARPNIEVRWIENAPHWLPLERAKELADMIAAFIRRIEVARR
jgi:pimeloyl-ACP methyl ester carboxylesterase